MTDKVCPRCKSNDYTFTLEGRASLFFIVDEGKVIPNGGEGLSTTECITCTCGKCGHVWHPRKFTYEIDDLY